MPVHSKIGDRAKNEDRQPSEVANFGFFKGKKDGNADSVCVLIAHWDFTKKPRDVKDTRLGDAEDVVNLQKTFKDKRNCNFRELLSPERNFLLELLASDEKLLNFFDIKEAPTVFILFVLSHGETGGVISTDHRIGNDYITFTTAEVFESIGKLEKFKSCLKLINLGPCRGSELKDGEQANQSAGDRNSVRVTFFPKMHNLVLFYSTVETTTSTRDDDSGTWFVKQFCKELNSTKENTPLVNFLTKVQFRIHQQYITGSVFNAKCTGQTPEVKMFTQDANFVISTLPENKQEAEGSSKCDANIINKINVNNAVDQQINAFYAWKSNNGKDIRGRKAVIFYEYESEQVERMKNALTSNLSFDTSDMNLTITNVKAFAKKQVPEYEEGFGCILTCFFGQIVENDQEICVHVKGASTPMPIGDIMYKLIGPKNGKWIGKPKLFFLIDQNVGKPDNAQKFKVEAERIRATNHSGWLVVIVKDKDLVDRFIEIFEANLLKQEGKSIQEVLSTLLTTSNNVDKLLFNSTLQYLLDFPDWQRNFMKPNFDMTIEYGLLQLSYDDLLRMEAENGVYLLSSVAGSGKTTLFKELTYDLRRSGINVLRIPLTKVLSFLSTSSTLQKFLEKATNRAPEEIEKITSGGKAIVFLDEFDEIPVKHHEKVLTFAKGLNEKTSVWIGSRPHEEQTIRSKLNVLTTVGIDPLNRDQQIELMQNLTNKSEDECRTLLKDFGAPDLLENPLHLTLFTKCPGKKNLYEIYHVVVRQDVEKCIEMRVGMKKDHINFGTNVEDYTQLLMDIAYLYLMGKASKALKENPGYAKKLNDTDIATVVNGEVSFLHKTFAEFLVAQKFLLDLKKTGDSDMKLFQDRSVWKRGECRNFVDSFFLNFDESSNEADEDDNSDSDFPLLPRSRKNVEEISSKLTGYISKHKNNILYSVFEKNLTHIIDILMPHITFEEDAAKCLHVERGAELLVAAARNEDIALQLLEMGAIKRAEELDETWQEYETDGFGEEETKTFLKKLLCGAAEVNAIQFLTKLGQKCPDLKKIIESNKEEIIDAAIVAAEHGHHQVLDFLLNNGVDVNFCNDDRQVSCVLEAACIKGDTKCREVLIKHGVNLTKPFNRHGQLTFALHVAVEYGHLRLVKFLVDGGHFPDVTLKDGDGQNALFLATEKVECLDVAKYLHGINNQLAHEKRKDGKSPLHLAAWNGNLEMCRWLVEEVRTDIHVIDNRQNTVLHWVASSRNENLDIFEYFVKLGVDINFRNINGKTALHCACESGHFQIEQKLLSLAANFRDKDNEGMNAVHLACIYQPRKSLYIMKLLHEKDSDLVNEINNNGQNALLYSLSDDSSFSWFNHHYLRSLIHWLVEKTEVKVNVVDKYGRTALILACKNDHWDINDSLLPSLDVNAKDKEGKMALHYACRHGDRRTVEKLLEKDVDLKAKNNNGWNALHYACKWNHREIVKLLHKKDSNLVKESTNDGRSALHFALKMICEELQLNYIQWLVEEAGVDVNCVDNDGQTALIVACERKHWNVVQFLLTLNVDINHKDNEGITALHIASHYGSLQIVQKLFTEGADLQIKDNKGFNAMHFAFMNIKLDIAKFLHECDDKLVKEKTIDGQSVIHALLDESSIEYYYDDYDDDVQSELLRREVELIRWLVEIVGVDVNVTDDCGRTALIMVCNSDWPRLEIIIDYLLTRSDIDVKRVDNGGKTALNCKYVQNKLLKLNFKDKDGFNVLHLACFNKDLEFAKLAHDENRNLIMERTNGGRTALDIACADAKSTNLDLISWLQECYKRKGGEPSNSLPIKVHK